MVQVFARADVELKAGGYFKDAIGHWAESYIQFYIKQLSLMGQRLLRLIQMDK